MLETDDILFVGILLFAAAIALRLGRRLPALGVLALLVAVGCLTRLVLGMVGVSGGSLDAAVPLSFLILVAVMAVLSFLGVLRIDARHDQTSVRNSWRREAAWATAGSRSAQQPTGWPSMRVSRRPMARPRCRRAILSNGLWPPLLGRDEQDPTAEHGPWRPARSMRRRLISVVPDSVPRKL